MAYDTSNVFARIIRGEIPSNKVYEDDQLIAIHDIAAAAPVHVLVMPKGEYISFHDFSAKASPQTVHHFFASITKIAQSLGVHKDGYRLITNHGADASQSVAHFHVHLLGGRTMDGLLPGDAHIR